MRERAAGCFVQIVEVGGQRGLDITVMTGLIETVTYRNALGFFQILG